MKLAIIGGTPSPKYYNLLDKKLNQLITTSQCFLFYVLCGYIEGNKSENETLGELWARKNGAPTLYIHALSVDKLIDKIIKSADYAIFILDGNLIVNKAFMKYKMSGKRGSVIRVADEK